MIFIWETCGEVEGALEDDNGEGPQEDLAEAKGSDDEGVEQEFVGKFLWTFVVKDALADLARLSEYISLTDWELG